MPFDLLLAFATASAVLIAIPGPNVALIVANSLAHGWRYGLVTVSGTASAMVLQLAVTVAGMSAFVALMADWFELLRWAGVLWLLWLAAKAWRAPGADLSATRAEPRAAAAIWARGFLVSLANPKTLLFFGAFLPQFVSPGAEPTRQLVVLAATFLAIAVTLDAVWALAADRLRGLLAGRGRLGNRLTAGLLASAGAGLALARRS